MVWGHDSEWLSTVQKSNQASDAGLEVGESFGKASRTSHINAAMVGRSNDFDMT